MANSGAVPVIGIGGITAQNCESVLDTEAAGVAVISAILGQYDSYGEPRVLHWVVAGGRSHAPGDYAQGAGS